MPYMDSGSEDFNKAFDAFVIETRAIIRKDEDFIDEIEEKFCSRLYLRDYTPMHFRSWYRPNAWWTEDMPVENIPAFDIRKILLDELNDEGYDREYLEEWSSGLEKLAADIRALSDKLFSKYDEK